MSRTKKLGSIYANNRKRRIVSDDEHSEDETLIPGEDHIQAQPEEMGPHQQVEHERVSHHHHHHHHHHGRAIKQFDPVARCEAKLRSLRQHLAILRHEAAEVEKEIARWEWEVAAAQKASRTRAREAERAAMYARNGHLHGYSMSGIQKRRRVLVADDNKDHLDHYWGITSEEGSRHEGGRKERDWSPLQAANGQNNKRPDWEQSAQHEDDHDDDDDDDHSVVEIDEMDIAMEHDTDEDSGASTWGKFVEKVPSPRPEFEVVIERPPSTLPLPETTDSICHISGHHTSAPSGSQSPLFFGSSDDFTDEETTPKKAPTLSPNPIELLTPSISSTPSSSRQIQNLCFSPLALSAPPPSNNNHSNGTNSQCLPPLALLPSTPMRMATRPRPPSNSSSFGSGSSGNINDGGEEAESTPPLQIITPKRPPTTSISSSSTSSGPYTHTQSSGKKFVHSPGFFGTYEERRKMRGLEPLPRVEFDEFEGSTQVKSRFGGAQANSGMGLGQGRFLMMG